jgi:hypothetical protein
LFFETGSLCVAQAGLKLKTLLALPLESWDYRNAVPCSLQEYIYIFNLYMLSSGTFFPEYFPCWLNARIWNHNTEGQPYNTDTHHKKPCMFKHLLDARLWQIPLTKHLLYPRVHTNSHCPAAHHCHPPSHLPAHCPLGPLSSPLRGPCPRSISQMRQGLLRWEQGLVVGRG